MKLERMRWWMEILVLVGAMTLAYYAGMHENWLALAMGYLAVGIVHGAAGGRS